MGSVKGNRGPPRPTSSAFSTRCPSCQELVSADATRDLWLVLRLDAVLERRITRCPSCQDLVLADATRDLWLVLRLDAVLDRSIPTAARALDTFPAIEARGSSSSAQWPHSATTTFRSSVCAFAPVGPQNHSLPSCNFHVRELEGLLRMSTNVSIATLHASANLLPTVLAPPFRVSKLNPYNFSSCRDALLALLPWLALILDLDESDGILSSLNVNNAPLRRLTELNLCSAMHRVVDGIAQLLDLSKMKMPSLSGTDDEDIECPLAMLAASLASLHAPSPCVLNLARNYFNEDDVQPLIKALAASTNLTSLASSKRGRSKLLAMVAACGVRMTADNLVLRLDSPGVQG
ncbi:hypothetical protein SPRG_08519 [Saprolegnia parasitica CBS 223.65]|uniref:Uncharacterized protein n=1 Tax=Saprolegnia parasitica (strain CBS 223.65) TaxID=695850 RepID=A0A067C6N2_SAPPC|nr:hypothetical protein SPRG_08519 [Saprolegnia parasitica CBS 223.65]KDO26158.1 hypothetical protein SPRG_08519 [Saprolegnia parasitica CBS 223.65]|eukprot:XP_012203152.1 hypothetical protein SPRG_08519 [Saprolegnia parasitica CBS 223.65]